MKDPTSRVRIRLTRQGAQAVFIGLFCLFGAVVRDLNLLVVLASLVTGVLWIQWRMGRRNLQTLVADQRMPHEAFAHEPFLVTLMVRNQAERGSVHQVTVSESIRQPYSLGETPSGSVSMTSIAPSQTASNQYQCVTSLRGRYQFGPLRIESTYPFGLLRAFRVVPNSTESLVVFPMLLKLKSDWRRVLQRHASGGARAGQRAGSSEGHFFGLRAWQAGDSRRWIHWRTTARIGEIAVRQFEHPRDEQLLLIVDLYNEADYESLAVERAVSLAATILESSTRTNSFRIALGIAGSNQRVVAGTTPPLIRQQGLTELAEARSCSHPDIESLLTLLGGFATKRWPLIIVSTRPRTADVWSTPAQRWLDHHGGMWVDVLSNENHQWIDWSLLHGKA